MSANASGTVWKTSRAKGSNLLALLAIADITDEQGRNAWPSPEHLAVKTRMTARAMRLILHKLERDGELVIELNTEQRVVKHGYMPPYFLHIRCVCDADAYGGGQSEKISVTAFARGRRPKGKLFLKPLDRNRQTFPRKGNVDVPESEKSGTAYKEDPSVDPLEKRERAADPLEALRQAWNETTCLPIRRCQTLTPKRRRWIRGALAERSLTDWVLIFLRVQASSYCRGERTDFVASLDWLISGPDQAVKILEGQYDDRPTRTDRQVQFARGADFSRSFAMLDTCPHEPHCLSGGACQRLRDLAAAKVATA